MRSVTPFLSRPGGRAVHGAEPVADIRIRRRCREFRYYRLQPSADRARIIHKKSAVLRVHRMKCQAQQTRFAAARKPASPRYIEKRRRSPRSVTVDNLNSTALLRHKQSAAGIFRLLNIFGICKSCRNLDQIKRRRCRWGHGSWRYAGAPATSSQWN